MKKLFKIVSAILLVLIAIFAFSFSKSWIQVGRQIKLSEKYTKLSSIGDSTPISENEKFVLRLQGWTQDAKWPCSAFYLKTHVSNFIGRDFTKSPSHIDRAFMSCRLERDFTPSQLNTYFFDNVYVGNGEYGVETIAQSLFGKTFGNLTKAEATTIGLIIQNPTLRKPPNASPAQ